MASELRSRARNWVTANAPKDVIDSLADPNLFFQLTGTRQSDLVGAGKIGWDAQVGKRVSADNGKTKGDLVYTYTTCNSLAGVYSTAIKLPSLGVSDGYQRLTALGKTQAWITPDEGLAPQFGDVYYKRIVGGWHVGVFLDPQGGRWNVLEAGQGGPGWTYGPVENGLKTITGHTGTDKVKKHLRNAISDLAGWINIDLLDGDTVPGTLVNWWTVTWQGDTYYYAFQSSSRVIWMSAPPPPGASVDGSYATQKGYGYYFVKGSTVTVVWGSGSEEVYSNPGTGTMKGTLNGQPGLVATLGL
jgi:hypothetical protein